MSDNRTNEPTEAQVEAAAKAIGITVINSRGAARFGWDDITEAEKALYMRGARAALVAASRAAQGAAPQAESVPKSTYISPSLPGMIRNLWKSDPSENSVRTALKLAGDLIQELIDLKAAPAPSSGVDEIWRGRIVTASFENGTGDLDCGLEECECPEHEQPPRPAGTYVTVRLVDKDERVGLTDVEIRVLAGKEENDE